MGHILNKITLIWFFKPAPLARTARVTGRLLETSKDSVSFTLGKGIKKKKKEKKEPGSTPSNIAVRKGRLEIWHPLQKINQSTIIAIIIMVLLF